MEDKKEKTENCFLVDYENVNKDGLNGIGALDSNDCVRIYYSKSAETLTFGLHRRIMASKAVFEYVKLDLPIKNAIDCRILFDLEDFGKLHRARNYYIVSKDSDFDRSIEIFRSSGINVSKISEICKYREKDAVKEQEVPADTGEKPADDRKRELQVRTFFGQHFKDRKYKEKKEQIIAAILGSQNKVQLNNSLSKLYEGAVVKVMLKELKPLIADLPTH